MIFSVETVDLSHQYNRQEPVLQGVNLQVPEGSIYGFLGPNGAGKTTTLRLLLGLLRIQQGVVKIFGRSLKRHRLETLARIGSFIESPSIYEHLTATENLRVWQKIYETPDTRVREVVELVGLGETACKKTANFSLGMKQRLSIAVALLHNPPLLILDEPTNGLDPSGIIEIRELLIRLNRENGTTILVSSHLLAEIEKLATHLGIIHRGRLVFQGTKDELAEQQRRVHSVSFLTNNQATALRVIGEFVPGGTRIDQYIAVPPLSNERIAGVNRALVDAGVEVYEIRQEKRDLEVVFMNLVEEPRA